MLIVLERVLNEMKKRTVVSLFSSAGIGELGISKDEFEILVSNEIVENRHKLYKLNYPETTAITGDIWSNRENIINEFRKKSDEEPFLIYATPPCQGMSSNGAGRLMHEIRKGTRLPGDERNRLIIPTLDIICELKPKWILLENVPNMQNTIIEDETGEYINIIDYIKKRLGNEYIGKPEVVNCADYGIAQTRRRLITIFTKTESGIKYFNEHQTFIPNKTHSQKEEKDTLPWVTIKDVIGTFPPLDSRIGCNERKDFHPCHHVQVLSDERYWWVSNTPANETAFSNQCCNPECMYQENQRHGSFIRNGIHISKDETPIYCEKCGQLLPRPSIIDKKTGVRRIIKGFDSAFRRMSWDEPSATLTQNMIFESSDKKLHPEQNRVLSIYEGLVIQTISDYEYKFEINGVEIPRNLYAEIIGESVPPRLIEIICKQIIEIEKK